MTAAVFVDTNIFVYARDVHDPIKKTRAQEWLDVLWREQRGRTSAQVLSEYYTTVTQKLKPGLSREQAWDDVRSIGNWNPRQIDTDLLARAYEIEGRHRLNWWDCLIVAAAQVQSCTLLLTEDMHDGTNFGGVIVRNPFKLGVAEESTAYAPQTRVASRHRGRGRPRKVANRPATASS
jgi:predicted nucleic acid-binding protein